MFRIKLISQKIRQNAKMYKKKIILQIIYNYQNITLL